MMTIKVLTSDARGVAMADPQTPLLTSEQLAEYLQVPLATIYRWAYAGTGPVGLRVGRHRRYRRADVESWLDAQRADHGDAA
jgi:excisionase family DNA binding protein